MRPIEVPPAIDALVQRHGLDAIAWFCAYTAEAELLEAATATHPAARLEHLKRSASFSLHAASLRSKELAEANALELPDPSALDVDHEPLVPRVRVARSSRKRRRAR